MITGKQWDESIKQLNDIDLNDYSKALECLCSWKEWQIEFEWVNFLRLRLDKEIECRATLPVS